MSVSTEAIAAPQPRSGFHAAFVVAWFFCLLFYFVQYAMRSAPSVMRTELTTAFGLSTASFSALLGLYYYTYSAFAIVSGSAVDRWGAKATIPIGTLVLAAGIALFGIGGGEGTAEIGRLLQGAGAAFAFVGAVYLASHGFPSKYLATAIGATQCVGMLGASLGQSAVAPLIHGVMDWHAFLIDSGIVTAVIAVALYFASPREQTHPQGSAWTIFSPYKVILSNPQSYLCGICAGLLFLPTTVGSMTWGVSFLQNGWHLGYAEAVNRASMVAMGWVVGSPVLGWVADHFGRRKPVLLASILLMLVSGCAIVYLPPNSLPPYLLAFVFGFFSGAAMIPYSIIKEVNPDHVKGSATGAINFLVFVMSAIASPFFGSFLQHLAGGGELTISVFTRGFSLGVAGIVLAGILTLFIRETGWRAKAPA